VIILRHIRNTAVGGICSIIQQICTTSYIANRILRIQTSDSFYKIIKKPIVGEQVITNDSDTTIIKTQVIPVSNSIVPHEPIQVHPASFPDRIPGWPIWATRRGFVAAWAIFPTRLLGSRAICGTRFCGFVKKIPDAVFRGGVACQRRGFLQRIGHLLVILLAALGG